MPRTDVPPDSLNCQLHKLLSVSVCPNVLGLTRPRSKLSFGDVDKVVVSLVEYIAAIDERSYSLLSVK